MGPLEVSPILERFRIKMQSSPVVLFLNRMNNKNIVCYDIRYQLNKKLARSVFDQTLKQSIHVHHTSLVLPVRKTCSGDSRSVRIKISLVED